jgi:two-component system phosphate regulon response regulator PhoB
MNKQIIIIEDDESLAEGLNLILQDEGFDTFVSRDGRDIETKIQQKAPDLFVIDYRLPNEDGVTIIKRLRSKEETKEVPIIMMSASQTNTPQIAIEAGADAFLSKPFDVDDLLLIVHNYLTDN